MADMKYLDLRFVVAWRHKARPGTPQRQDGYGSKIPSLFQLRIGHRWHRVYTVCWSNAGTEYVVVGGRPIYLESGWHVALEKRFGQLG